MTDQQAASPLYDLRSDDDEPEEEDTRRSSALIVKPPPLQVAEPDSASSNSSAITSAIELHMQTQRPANAERVYPWVATVPGTVSVITESAMMTSSSLYASAVRSESVPRRDGVTTALLAGSQAMRSESPLGYGTNVKMQRRHSILRMSASETASGHGLRKSASVEFVLAPAQKEVVPSIHASTSSIGREPRRLTVEEKTELYRVRPDLEIGPVPFYNEKIQELNRRNQRRIIFAMFGGMISIVLLLVFFSMWEQNK